MTASRWASVVRPRLALLVVGGTLFLLLAPVAAPAPAGAPSATAGPAGTPPAVTPLGSGPCGGPHVAAQFSGTLSVDGGSTPPAVANVTVRALYAYQLDYTPKGGSTVTSCSTGSATATTDAQGGFLLNLTLLPSGCNPTSGACSNYTGPFGPTSFGVTGTIPAGYFVSSRVNGTTVALHYVIALGSAGLAPFGRTTVSALAPVALVATGLAGDGTPSPANLTFDWLLSGSGWTVVSGQGTDQLTVVSQPAAGSETVEVFVNGTYNGTAETAAPRTAVLTPVATALIAESVSPTSLDAGTPATFSLTGSGSAGYPYTATVFPGLGVAPVSAPCATTPQNGGLVSVTCTLKVTYPGPGIATPSANLSNGYSSATGATNPFPALTVAPGLVLALTPSPAQGYVGFPIAYTVSVSAGTGTAPLGPACLWPGDGSVQCSATGGPTWTFQATFGQPGTYAETATVADAAGSNRTVTDVTLVAVVPHLDALSANSSTGTAGTPYAIATRYTGGALPAAYWWNDSMPAGTLSHGILTADGPLGFTYQPVLAGLHNLTLTVVDRLGTVTASSLRVLVAPGPASAIVPAGGPTSWTTAAGAPYNVSWAIVDPAGQVVSTAAVAVTLTPEGASAMWLNLSGGAAIAPNATGAFLLVPSDWSAGYLNFSVAAERAGPLRLAVGSALPVAGTVNATLTLTVTFDRLHLALSDPVSVPNGTEHRTLWRIADRFGNPVPTGYVVILITAGAQVSQADSPVLFNGTVSVVWVNFTFPAGVGGSVVVRSAWGQVLLLPFTAAPAAAASFVDLAVLAVLGAAAAACLVAGARARPRSASDRRAPSAPPSDGPDDAELRRLAAGREHVLRQADATVPRELADLVRDFPGIPPTPTELAEWVGSLVNEGALRASLGPDGRPRFVRRSPGDTDRPEAPPKVELDAAALEAALAQRPAPDPDGAPEGDADERGGP